MQRIPYTYSQAQALCNKLQHLVGSTFNAASDTYGEVECVAISPFDQVNKKKFLLYYLISGNATAALQEEYKGLLYDVVVIARSTADHNELVQEDVTTWLKKNDMSLDFFPDGTYGLVVREDVVAYLQMD